MSIWSTSAQHDLTTVGPDRQQHAKQKRRERYIRYVIGCCASLRANDPGAAAFRGDCPLRTFHVENPLEKISHDETPRSPLCGPAALGEALNGEGPGHDIRDEDPWSFRVGPHATREAFDGDGLGHGDGLSHDGDPRSSRGGPDARRRAFDGDGSGNFSHGSFSQSLSWYVAHA